MLLSSSSNGTSPFVGATQQDHELEVFISSIEPNCLRSPLLAHVHGLGWGFAAPREASCSSNQHVEGSSALGVAIISMIERIAVWRVPFSARQNDVELRY